MKSHLDGERVLSRRAREPGHRIGYGAGPRQFGELRTPVGPGPHPVAVVVHGGCWRDIADLGYMEALAEDLTEAGWATWNLEFRTLGTPGGGWPGTFRDVSSGADHLRELARDRPLDLGRVVSVGHSSGGHLALWLAARRRLPETSPLAGSDRPLPLHGVISLAGIADLEEFHARPRRACGTGVAELLGGEPAGVPERVAAASPAELLPLGVPQLLITGEEDPDVPPAHVAGYARRAREAGDVVRERILTGAGHFEVVAPWIAAWGGVRREILDFLSRIVGPG